MPDATRPPPRPPLPELVRRPEGPFGWLDAHLLHEGWLARLGPDAAAVLVLLALAADRRGASYFGRERMAQSLGLDVPRLAAALLRLRELRLVAHRPWREGCADGVWQLLPVPRRDAPSPRSETPPAGRRASRAPAGPSANAPDHIAAILARLGTAADRQDPADSRRR